jgi:NAD(P) transhydrogenase subunit alpha
VLSLGAKFIEVGLETSAAEGKGGYAQAMDESFYRRQREMMTRTVSEHDVVITTASVAGAKAPVLITADMVAAMAPGSVVMDLAAERGGNCEVTQPGSAIVHGGVNVIGPLNLASEAPFHASQMYAKNISTFLVHLVRQGQWRIDIQDEITRDTLVARDGQVVHQRIRELLGVGPLVVKDTIPLE